MDLHVYFHLGGVDIAAVKQTINALVEKVDAMSGSVQEKLETLRGEVEEISSVSESVVTFIQGVPQLITDAVQKAQAAGATPEQLAAFDELSQKLDEKSKEMAAAVTASTPAA